MIGSPGSGKTMLAKRLPGILSPLSLHMRGLKPQMHCAAGKLCSDAYLISKRPYRSPHHEISDDKVVCGVFLFWLCVNAV